MSDLDSLIEKLNTSTITENENEDILLDQLIENDKLTYESLLELFKTTPNVKHQFVNRLESNSKAFNNLITISDKHLIITTKLVPELSDKTIFSFLNQSLELLNKIYYKDFIAKVGIAEADTTIIDNSQYLLKFISSVILHYIKENKSSLINLENLLPTIILYCDRRFLELAHISSQVVLILSKCIQINHEQTEQILLSIIQDFIDEADVVDDSKISFFIIFSSISLLFHINSDIAEQIFTLDSIQLKKFTSDHLQSHYFVIAALEALSSACISKKCRALVAENFYQLVQTAFENSNNQSVQLLAASILVKTKANSETNQKEDVGLLNEFSIIFEDTIAEFVIEEEKEVSTTTPLGSSQLKISKSDYQIALEGLAYTSLITIVKSRVITNENLIKNLIESIKSTTNLHEHSVWIYCSLCILVNITNYNIKLSSEQKRLRDLKNYAGKSNLESDEESDTIVDERNKIILDSGIVGIISNNCPRFSKSSKESVATLLRNLVSNTKHRSKFVQQGGLAVLIYLILPVSTDSHTAGVTPSTINTASSALSKALISIDPSLAFSSKISPLITIKPLIEQLQNDLSDIPLLNTFESLLALTNIASIDDSCRNQIIRLGWEKIDTLMTNSNTLVQRASIELICNLAMSPIGAEKFLNGSKPSTSKLELLAAFTDSEDKPTSTAATGALAILSEWGEPAVEVIGNNEKCMIHIINLLSDSTDIDICIRAISAIRNIIVGAKQYNQLKVIEFCNNHQVADVIKQTLNKNRNSDIISLGLETIKVLLGK